MEVNLNTVDLVAALAEEKDVVDSAVAHVLKVENGVAVMATTATKTGHTQRHCLELPSIAETCQMCCVRIGSYVS